MISRDTDRSGGGMGFAERLLEVIDSGRRTATYKLALLLALLDLCARRSDELGQAPTVLHTRELAVQVVGLYWPQVAPFRLSGSTEALELRQISTTRSKIVDATASFRRAAETSGATSLWLARWHIPDVYEATLDRIEQTLAEQPIPRLQIVGSNEEAFPFLYDIDWGCSESFPVQRLRRAGPRGPAIRLLPGAGDELVRLAPLVRPLVELHWTRMVARFNGVATAEEDLRSHLFGSARAIPSKAMRGRLLELQAGRCFYCEEVLAGSTEVDHFIPRVRCGIDAIENLVLSDRPCNGDKSDLLAAPVLVASWARRNTDQAEVLTSIAHGSGIESDHLGTMAVARSIYGHLPMGGSPMWEGRKRVVRFDPSTALHAMTVNG